MKRLALIPMFAAAALLTPVALGHAADATPARALQAPITPPAQLLAQRLGGSSMSHMALLATPGGRDLLAHAVACALPASASFTTIDRSGAPFTFAGGLGLAPAWTSRATTADERDRLTVCLRSHGFGTIRT